MPNPNSSIAITPVNADAAPDLNRAAVRATSDFFLAAADICASVAGGDLYLGLIWLTVVDRGARKARKSPEKWSAYLKSGAVRPDEERPPISIYAISQILGQPYETTRRGAQRLISMGMLVRVRKGVIAPAAFMNSTLVREANAELQVRLRRWLISLDRQGLVQLAGGAAALWPGPTEAERGDVADPYVDEERRKYSRLALGFTVDAGRTVAEMADGNLLRGLLLVAIVQANVGRLAMDNELSRQFGDYMHPPPDSIRRPISIFALAESLHLPYETARRNVTQMAEAGLIERSREGVRVPTATVMQPKVVATAAAANNLFREFIRSLAEAGLAITPNH